MSRKNFYSDIGIRIKKVRESLNLTQKAFAESLGITQSWLSEIETGQKRPSEVLLTAIQYRYKIRKKWLMFGDGEMFEPPPEFKDRRLEVEPKIIGNRIRQIRLEKNISLQTLANLLNIPLSLLANLEKGEYSHSKT